MNRWFIAGAALVMFQELEFTMQSSEKASLRPNRVAAALGRGQGQVRSSPGSLSAIQAAN
jgi:hypothetical protein